jgi:hypothetical protein
MLFFLIHTSLIFFSQEYDLNAMAPLFFPNSEHMIDDHTQRVDRHGTWRDALDLDRTEFACKREGNGQNKKVIRSTPSISDYWANMYFKINFNH